MRLESYLRLSDPRMADANRDLQEFLQEQDHK